MHACSSWKEFEVLLLYEIFQGWDRHVFNYILSPSKGLSSEMFNQTIFEGIVKYFLYIERNFPVGPAVKTLPSDAGGAGSTPGQGIKLLHVAHGQKTGHKQ